MPGSYYAAVVYCSVVTREAREPAMYPRVVADAGGARGGAPGHAAAADGGQLQGEGRRGRCTRQTHPTSAQHTPTLDTRHR